MKLLRRFYSLSLWLSVACLTACSQGGLAQKATKQKIQSITLDARNTPDPSVLVRLDSIGVSQITLIQFGFQQQAYVPEIRMNTDADWFSESDRGIQILARQANTLGMGIILKPHVWMGRYSAEGQSRADIGFDNEEDWRTWETQYQTFLLHYARLAEDIDADILVIGTELARATQERPDFWRNLIREIRQIYNGSLTYAANWWGEYEDISFWNDLDYIGIQAYFELSHERNPTDKMLHEGWEPYKKTMRGLSEQTNRPILFTEIGYRNVPTAAAEPWQWPNRDEMGKVKPDDALQTRLYQAFFQSLWDEPWFAGAILWKWKSDDRRRQNYLDFSPQDKPAEAAIAEQFKKQNP